MKHPSRRQFVGAAAGVVGMTAASYARVPGANDRISIGMLGCGSRSAGHRRMAQNSKTDMNVNITAVCDLWTGNRDKAAADVQRRFGQAPRPFKYSEEMLAFRDIDAVMIATGDFQHAKLLVEVVRAGKDCYCEKPMANVLEEAKAARKAVLGSKQVVQMGSQWLSDPYQIKVRDLVRSGDLGKISRIEQTWNVNEPRWRQPDDPDISSIRESDTDWKRWLLGKPYRPFDPRVYFEFRLYKDFSGGLADQWMSHGSGLVHFYMDEDVPLTVTANGGIFAWDDGRENPDTFTAVATYAKGFCHVFQAQFGNSWGSHSAIMGKNGTAWSEGGEGSERWLITPRGGRGQNLGSDRPITIPGHDTIGPANVTDDSKDHFDDWVRSMRARKQPNGDIHSGFRHSVAAIMGARAYREGRKMYWDPRREEISERPPTA